MIEYYVVANGIEILFCICEEGSAMDLAVKHAEVQRREKYTKQLHEAIQKGTPLPMRKVEKDILTALERRV